MRAKSHPVRLNVASRLALLPMAITVICVYLGSSGK